MHTTMFDLLTGHILSICQCDVCGEVKYACSLVDTLTTLQWGLLLYNGNGRQYTAVVQQME